MRPWQLTTQQRRHLHSTLILSMASAMIRIYVTNSFDIVMDTSDRRQWTMIHERRNHGIHLFMCAHNHEATQPAVLWNKCNEHKRHGHWAVDHQPSAKINNCYDSCVIVGTFLIAYCLFRIDISILLCVLRTKTHSDEIRGIGCLKRIYSIIATLKLQFDLSRLRTESVKYLCSNVEIVLWQLWRFHFDKKYWVRHYWLDVHFGNQYTNIKTAESRFSKKRLNFILLKKNAKHSLCLNKFGIRRKLLALISHTQPYFERVVHIVCEEPLIISTHSTRFAVE